MPQKHGQTGAHSSPCPPLNSPASLVIGWGHVTSFGQRTVVDSEMSSQSQGSWESVCLPLSLSLSLPLHGDLGGCPFPVEQPRDEGRQCVLHWALYSSEQELNYYMKLVRVQGFFVTAGHSSLSWPTKPTSHTRIFWYWVAITFLLPCIDPVWLEGWLWSTVNQTGLHSRSALPLTRQSQKLLSLSESQFLHL